VVHEELENLAVGGIETQFHTVFRFAGYGITSHCLWRRFEVRALSQDHVRNEHHGNDICESQSAKVLAQIRGLLFLLGMQLTTSTSPARIGGEFHIGLDQFLLSSS
jgi:hypothetical protein